MLPFTLAGGACVQTVEIPAAVRKYPDKNKRIRRSVDQWKNPAVTPSEKYLGDIDFSPSWNIRREPEYMEGDQTGIIYDFYDDTERQQGNGFFISVHLFFPPYTV